MANTYVNGVIHVRRGMCDTCIFRPGNLMHLEEGRVEQMVADAGDHGCIPCHEHLNERINPVCSGFYTLHRNQVLQVAERLNVIEWRREA